MSRPTLFERRAYTSNLPVEEFMVPLLRGRIEQVLNSLPTELAGFKVLDMGCGGQPFRGLLEQRGYQYVSADTQNPLGIVHHIAEVDKDLPLGLLGDAPFDFILCTEVMEHVALGDKAFSNFAALLRPGGVILITCPHARSGRGSKSGAWLLAKMVRGVYRLIKSRWLQDRYSLNDERYPVYLSNLAVIEKPA